MYKIKINGKLYKSIDEYCNKNNDHIVDFNQPVEILENVINCSGMFSDCYSFNQPVIIPEGVKDCSDMFYYCEEFNQPVKIPYGVEDCTDMFSNCTLFNKPVIIPNSVKYCSGMFFCCNSFNQPIKIPDSVKNFTDMFYACKSFDKSITVNFNNLYLFENEVTITNKTFNNLKINTKILKECSFNKTIKIKPNSNITIKCSDKEFAEISLLRTLD